MCKNRVQIWPLAMTQFILFLVNSFCLDDYFYTELIPRRYVTCRQNLKAETSQVTMLSLWTVGILHWNYISEYMKSYLWKCTDLNHEQNRISCSLSFYIQTIDCFERKGHNPNSYSVEKLENQWCRSAFMCKDRVKIWPLTYIINFFLVNSFCLDDYFYT